MRATIMYGAGDVRVEDVPDARPDRAHRRAHLRHPRRHLRQRPLALQVDGAQRRSGRRMGHEFIGVVEAVGATCATVKVGDLVVAPFLWSDGTCVFCREGLQQFMSPRGAVRLTAKSTAARARRSAFRRRRDPRRPARLTGTKPDAVVAHPDRRDGYRPSRGLERRGLVRGGRSPSWAMAPSGSGGDRRRRLGAERILLLGRNPGRIALAKEFGATDIVPERGEEGVERVGELTAARRPRRARMCRPRANRRGPPSASPEPAERWPGRCPEAASIPDRRRVLEERHVSGGLAPVRAYVKELLPDVLEGSDRDRTRLRPHGGIENVPDGYAR